MAGKKILILLLLCFAFSTNATASVCNSVLKQLGDNIHDYKMALGQLVFPTHLAGFSKRRYQKKRSLFKRQLRDQKNDIKKFDIEETPLEKSEDKLAFFIAMNETLMNSSVRPDLKVFTEHPLYARRLAAVLATIDFKEGITPAQIRQLSYWLYQNPNPYPRSFKSLWQRGWAGSVRENTRLHFVRQFNEQDLIPAFDALDRLRKYQGLERAQDLLQRYSVAFGIANWSFKLLRNLLRGGITYLPRVTLFHTDSFKPKPYTLLRDSKTFDWAYDKVKPDLGIRRHLDFGLGWIPGIYQYGWYAVVTGTLMYYLHKFSVARHANDDDDDTQDSDKLELSTDDPSLIWILRQATWIRKNVADPAEANEAVFQGYLDSYQKRFGELPPHTDFTYQSAVRLLNINEEEFYARQKKAFQIE